MFKILVSLVLSALVFSSGILVGSVMGTIPAPRETHVYKINYDPQVDEPKDVSWGWLP